MANRPVYLAETKDCDVMGYNAGPWQRDSVTFGFSEVREKPLSSEPYRAHPILAPVAWIVGLLAGAAFWVAVFRLVF